jgi:acetyl-CoA carboxylase carboxyltransferase component
MLDAIIDLRTPRILLILRNAFGGAYAAFNSYATGADVVLALPTTRVAVMGTAGKEFVYKTEIRQMREEAAKKRKAGMPEAEVAEWLKAEDVKLNQRYERELMNPREALSLGSISEIVMPTDLRRELVHHLKFLLNHYGPGPMVEPQREFH